MEFYDKELQALKRSGRLRTRRIFDPDIVDCASNDYLGLAEEPQLLDAAVARLKHFKVHSPKASMLVNGYHPIHQEFEQTLAEANGFEAGLIIGSGFSANIAMIEALVRKGDTLFMDALYHASGQLASHLVDGDVVVFEHNNAEDLKQKIVQRSGKRNIIAVEGIYSMDGDLLNPEIIDLADLHQAILIVDEAHSSGVVGPNLLGIFDLYHRQPKPHYIKMGTLGKAYGSFGAYILASQHIVDFLVNRAKPVIYATAPSLFDTALGLEAFSHIQKYKSDFSEAIRRRHELIETLTGKSFPGLIVPIVIGDNSRVMVLQKELLDMGYLVGAIRQPTVEQAIIRLIARTSIPLEALQIVLEKLVE